MSQFLHTRETDPHLYTVQDKLEGRTKSVQSRISYSSLEAFQITIQIMKIHFQTILNE
jgi:hypothetical protein